MRLDHFVELDAKALGDAVELNLQAYRNEYSLYMNVGTPMERLPEGRVLVDQLYGQAYDHAPAPGAAIYGVTERIPDADLDARADFGFLRIPFAKVPRFRVGSLTGLKQLIAQLPRRARQSPLLFRGQTQEYLVGRSPETLRALYDDEQAREPSLRPSGARLGLDLDHVLPEWAALLRYALLAMPYGETDRLGQLSEFGSHYLFRRFAAAVAQHYGLPSSGLDVTTELDIGLFFAFTRMVRNGGVLCCERVNCHDPWPVLYAMEPYPDRVQSNFGDETPAWLPLTRPHRQHARFLHRGWGLSQNESARWLLAAFYLDPAGDFGSLPSAHFLFPDMQSDLMLAVGIALKESYLGEALPDLGRFLSYFEAVAPGSGTDGWQGGLEIPRPGPS